MRVSLCITVLNEEKNIQRLLESIAAQTKPVDEVIIIDGGSTDTTVEKIKRYNLGTKHVKVLIKKGNRAVGRNEAIKNATGDIIAITDAGCTLNKQWVEEISRPFRDENVQVVSGYYAGRPKNAFEASLVPYVLVMPDKVNSSSFLPSTRSMAMRKQQWKKLGGFPEAYQWNEDYVFSKKMEKSQVSMVFAPKALVYWFPRETWIDAWNMFYAFARGDAQAGIWRPKVILLLFRVILFSLLLIEIFLVRSWEGLAILGLLGILYLLWAVWKNYRYVKNTQAILYLPVWQITSDSAVFFGTIIGSIERLCKSR